MVSLGIIGCERSGFPALCVLGKENPEVWEGIVAAIPVPCLGGVEEEMMLEVLLRCDRLLLVGCPPLSCRGVRGSVLAEKRVARVSQLLAEAGIPKEVQCVFAHVHRLGELKARVLA